MRHRPPAAEASERPSARLARHRPAVLGLCAWYEATNPRVFGSVLHGTDTADSDLDLLVETETGLWMAPPVAHLAAALGRLLGVRVDVLTAPDLPAAWRDEALAQARPLALWSPATPAPPGPLARHRLCPAKSAAL